MSIRKYANELKVHKKTVKTAIKQDLRSDLNSLITQYRVFLKTKQKATPHPNIGLLKIAIEEEWNKISEEFILKACKSFQRHVDTIIDKKNGSHTW